jgi:ABC-type dipeptide/oligopeptide/nickel transport system ATPase component/ABC-type dipeptide/oligopeptide/nickel transport system permease subunit
MSTRSRLTSPAGIVVLAGFAVIIAAAVVAPFVWGAQADATDVSQRLQGASWQHPFGTDELGRDVLARVLVATRTSVLLALGATAIAVGLGVVLGLIPTVLPRVLRRMLTGLIDILLAFPWLLLALFFSAIWGASATGAMLAVGFAGIPAFARLAYTLSSSIMGRDYVRAARIVGVGPVGVLTRHVVPNAAGALLVNAAVHASGALLSFAGLSFLGLGVQSPEYDWGRLLREGIARIYVNPMAAIGPGIAIVLTGLVLTLTSDVFATTPRRGALLRTGLRGLRPAFRPAARRAASAPHLVTADEADAVSVAHGLRIAFPAPDGRAIERVHGVDLEIAPGEVVGIVGESGSGKSITAMALAGLIEPPGAVTADELRFRGVGLLAPLSAAARRRLGLELAMVFQDPLTSLNPALTIGRQLTEAVEAHEGVPRSEARERARRALASVGIPDPERRLGQYPHEFSGGMRQRAMIAMGLMGSPKLIVADEPTTALDVTVQRQVLQTLRRAQTLTDTAVLFISHDIALVAGFCDRILVMKDGEVVEQLAADRLLTDARHPYTRALIACVPDMSSDRTQPLPVIGELGTVRRAS